MTWPKAVQEIEYFCKADSTHQPALVYASPHSSGEKPLLVGLHTWSFDYKQTEGETVYARWCIQNDWLFIHPDFRGPNTTPQAMGSEYVVADILDAVEYMTERYSVDTERIYLIGVSGGGHAALLMAGRTPDIWAGVSAWCGISDIKKWWEHNIMKNAGYESSIEASCGGKPDNDSVAAEECLKRSPISYLRHAQSVNLDINAGVRDGRQGSVPFSQSLYAFNEVATDINRIEESDIEAFHDEGKVPPHGDHNVSEILYEGHTPLFVKTSLNARVVIFDGSHEIVHLPALNWLAQQRKGVRASWIIDNPVFIDVSSQEAQSGK